MLELARLEVISDHGQSSETAIRDTLIAKHTTRDALAV
jgi:hypothetical protein